MHCGCSASENRRRRLSRQSFTLVDHLLSPLLWHIIVGPGYIDTVNRLIDEFIVRLTWHQHLPPVAPSIALELHNVPMLEPQELKRLLVQYCIDCCSCPLVFSLWEYVGPTLDRLDRGVQLEPNGSPSRSSVGLANDNTALSTTQQNTKCI